MSRDYDVLVIGSGAAGLSAAISAADSGATVLICESEQVVGGSSRLSGGHFYAAGTSVQEKAGTYDDTPDDMYEHYMTLNQWMVDPRVVRKYCDLSGPTFEWLRNLGVEFLPEGVYPSGVSSIPGFDSSRASNFGSSSSSSYIFSDCFKYSFSSGPKL